MKKFLGVAVLILVSSVSAHAQRSGPTGGGSGNATLTYGGGGIGGGISSDVGHLPIYGRTIFATAAYRGDPAFAPSSFMTFEDAVKEGLAASGQGKTVAQAAADNQTATRAKSRVEFVQDHSGNVIPVKR